MHSKAAEELACTILEAAQKLQTKKEAWQERLLSKMVKDPTTRTTCARILDSCFRCTDPKRVIDQICYVTKPNFLLKQLAKLFPGCTLRIVKALIQTALNDVLAPGEDAPLIKRLKTLQTEHVQINLNRLGEAILGDNEAERRLEQNIRDLANPHVHVISVKISSIASQICLVAYSSTLERLKAALRRLYRAALKHNKFVNLDMEEYNDLRLTVQLFQEVLSEPEFETLSAGIALQSYIPDSFYYQKQLTEWAIGRKAPIKIRLVKGANLGMEQVTASLKEWQQAPYTKKEDVDANFKNMLHYALEHAQHVHIGIGSHNLFDLAYAMVLAKEHKIEEYVTIEMLAGMAPHIARVMPHFWKKVLLYLPCAKKEEFQNAVAYLMRRLDENSSPNNFLPHLFGLKPKSREWNEQFAQFEAAVTASKTIATNSLRGPKQPSGHFTNEPELDFSQKESQQYAEQVVKEWQVQYHEIPLVIGGHKLVSQELTQGLDPSRPQCNIHTHFLAQEYQANVALEFAQNSAKKWAELPLKERVEILKNAAQLLRNAKKNLSGAMMQEVAKNIPESEGELCEAIDFIEYYVREVESHPHAQELFSTGKTCLVLTPWNFPVSIATSAIASSLACGYSVLFKPAQEAILCGWLLAECFWQAGVPKDVLQFITCQDEPIGSMLVSDPRVDTVILTGATETAKKLLKMRPNLQLFAETGGKNSLIVTKLSDRDLAVKDAVQSAFGYAGQKCSALSLLILEEEVYNDPAFMRQLYDAASSLKVGPSYKLDTVVNPLIRPASPHLLRALTTLDAGESWLLEPKQDAKNPHLWSPGIKLGVKPGSFMHQTELFGPVLGVMSAQNLKAAVDYANQTAYGLTAGIHSLDPREQDYWKEHIVAGNLYINRPITGAIVARQPFGGTKASSFGVGMKVGGPNYLLQLASVKNIPPLGMHDLSPALLDLQGALGTHQDTAAFYKAAGSMVFWWDNYFSKPRILRHLVGQTNILEYRPHKEVLLLIHDQDALLDIFMVFAAAQVAGSRLICALSRTMQQKLFTKGSLDSIFARFGWRYGTIQEALNTIQPEARVRALSEPSYNIGTYVDISPPCANGRIELLHFLRECAISHDYHRYGSLMAIPSNHQDQEQRKNNYHRAHGDHRGGG